MVWLHMLAMPTGVAVVFARPRRQIHGFLELRSAPQPHTSQSNPQPVSPSASQSVNPSTADPTAADRTTVTVQPACATTCDDTLPSSRRKVDAPRAPSTR